MIQKSMQAVRKSKKNENFIATKIFCTQLIKGEQQHFSDIAVHKNNCINIEFANMPTTTTQTSERGQQS